jgi:allophanate hydrolase
MTTPPLADLSIPALQARLREGSLTPLHLVEELDAAITADEAACPRHAWIHRLSLNELRAQAERLQGLDPASLPLYGIPFAIKDNIDLAGVPTTAACPDFAYTPTQHATVVRRLIEAGAIAVGKTNLDQFATGLVGARSPYGAGRNALDARFISGGSSSGSAIAVARAQVSFALGTDTAGSGRVPAMLNNIVGLKPSLGRLPATGMLPACRTLDTVSVFALSTGDAARVLEVAQGQDTADAYSRPFAARGPALGQGGAFRFGVPREADLAFYGDDSGAAQFAAAVARLQALGGTPVPVDLRPFREVAQLLYGGPWLAERYAAIRGFIQRQPQALHPVTRAIIEPAAGLSAAAAFEALYRLQALKRQTEPVWAQIDTLVVPTAPRHHTLDAVLAEPVTLNSQLGHYTNFVNLLDLAAVAVPTGFGANPLGGAALPFGVTLIGPAGSDWGLLALAGRLHAQAVDRVGATPHAPHRQAGGSLDAATLPADRVLVAVCGAHLQGLPLNAQLTSRDGTLVRRTTSSPAYRLYALPGGPPHRPGMVHVGGDGENGENGEDAAEGPGAAIEVEVWSLPMAHYGSFVASIPAPLGIGPVRLADGSTVQGFVCDPQAVRGARDITAYGGWRAFLAAQG